MQMQPAVDVTAISVSEDGSVRIDAAMLSAFVSEKASVSPFNTTGPNASTCSNKAGCANTNGCTGNNVGCANLACH